MSRRVLVTRPLPGAEATAARLATMGYQPVMLPLTRIEPVEPPPLDAAEFDAVAVTSANAMRHAPAGLLAALRGKPLFAVGEASARAARDSGFTDVRSADGDARDLARLIGGEAGAGARLLHVAGVERTAGFEEALRGAGFAVTIAEVYRATKISHSTDFLDAIAEGGPIEAALVMSPRAGALLAGLAARRLLGQALEKTCFLCISENAAATLRGTVEGRVRVSRAPNEDSVLRLLSSGG